jgi:hypothetical protein
MKKPPPELEMHGYHYRNGEPVVFPKPRKPQKRNPILRAEQFSDFRTGIDRVVRFGEWCWVVPGDGPNSYAPEQVQSDALTEQGRRNLESLPPPVLRVMIQAIRFSPYLSEDGKRERLEFIASLPKFVVL